MSSSSTAPPGPSRGRRLLRGLVLVVAFAAALRTLVALRAETALVFLALALVLLILVGLVRPSLLRPLFGRVPGRLRALAVLGSALLVTLAALGLMPTPKNSEGHANTGARGTLTTGAPVAAASARVGAPGTALRVDTAGGPLSGLTLTVPAGGYSEERDLKVSYRPIAGHGYGADVHPLSPLITVDAGKGYAGEPITVRVPITLPAGHFAMGFYYDERSGRLEGLPLVELGADHATVLTRHFSSFFITSIAEPLLLGLDFDTGFKPGVDDWEFPNYGSILEPGGHCAGQSISAMWYFYERRQAKGEPPLFGRYDNNGTKPATPDLWEDDVLGYRLASRVQNGLQWSSKMRKTLLDIERLDERAAYFALAYAMRLTGGPQYLAVRSTAGNAGHAVVAYRIAAGRVFVADPNRPGKTDRTIPVTGDRFGSYSSAEVAGGPGRVYDKVRYLAASALIDWEDVGFQFTLLERGTVGDLFFPRAYDVGVYDAKGDGVVLSDGMTLDKTAQKIWLGTLEGHGDHYPLKVPVGMVARVNGAWTGQWVRDPVRDVIDVTLRPGPNVLDLVVVASQPQVNAWVDFRRYRITVSPAEKPKTGQWVLTSTVPEDEQPYDYRKWAGCPAVQQSADTQSATFTVAYRGACSYNRGTTSVTASWTALPQRLTPGTPFPMTLGVEGNSGITALDPGGANRHQVNGTVSVRSELYQCRGSECRASGTRESETSVWASFTPQLLPGMVLGSTRFQLEASDTPIARPGSFNASDVFRVIVRSSEAGDGGGLATAMRHIVTYTYAWQPTP